VCIKELNRITKNNNNIHVVVVFDGPVYPIYSHHMYVIVVFGGPV
jgi:hypothetical protein